MASAGGMSRAENERLKLEIKKLRLQLQMQKDPSQMKLVDLKVPQYAADTSDMACVVDSAKAAACGKGGPTGEPAQGRSESSSHQGCGS